jgi:zinc protease
MAGFIALPGLAGAQTPAAPVTGAVVASTLANGMRIVLLPNRLAPVVTTVITYGVGSNDDPAPGIAHATEHMLFRGTHDVSAGQFADIAERAGAQYDAETTNTDTRYYFNIPSSYVGLALRLEADRMNGATIAASAWKTERGAIEQEIRARESIPGWSVVMKMRKAFFGDTPYASDAGGTVTSFEKMTAADIARFYKAWYHPNNATLVVAGNIDPAALLAQIHTIFDAIPSQVLPAHTAINVAPLKATTIDAGVAELPVPVVGIAYRFPGLRDPDFAVSEVLITALDSGRGALFDLTAKGQVLGAFGVSSAFNEVGIAEVAAVGPPGVQPSALEATVGGVIAGYRATGIPDDLVQAAKIRLLSTQSYRQASISGLAFAWAGALSAGQQSPDFDYDAIARVSTDDVNRVLRTYMDSQKQIAILLAPKKTTSMPKIDPRAGVENVKYTSDKHEALPHWAVAYFQAPLQAPHDGDLTVIHLPNGLSFTVRNATFSPVVVLRGEIRTSPDLYQPAGKDGVASLTDNLLPWGTTTYDRKSYQAQLDNIAANVSLGSDFGMTVQAKNFDEGVRLLADGMLHPAFPQAAFEVLKRDDAQSLAALASQPGTQASIAQINALYPPGDPRRRRATAQTMSAVGIDDVRNWFRFSYRPDLTTIALVGDVSPEHARATVTKYFGDWKAVGKKPTFKYPVIKPSKSQNFTVSSSASVQASVTLTQVINVHPKNMADRIALELANTILSGQGTGSLLFRDVRTAKGYVYSIDSSLDIGKTSSTFSVEFASDPSNARKAEAEAVAVIRRLQNVPLPLEDVQRAKALLLAQQVLPLESYSGVASNMLDDATSGYTRNDSDLYWAMLLDTTPTQLRDAMRKWIDTSRFVRVTVQPGA